jgi:hypothetical protein
LRSTARYRNGFALLFVLVLAVVMNGQGLPGTSRQQGGKALKDIEIGLYLPSREWITGTSFQVTVKLKNQGPASFDAPAAYAPGPFEFSFHPADPTQPVQVISARKAARSIDPDSAPFPDPTEPLAAGAAAEYPQNLAEQAIPPIPAGEYTIAVNLVGNREKQSFPQPVKVAAPQVRLLNAAVGPTEQRLTLTLTHMPPQGPVQLLQRDSIPGNPIAGVIHRRRSFKDRDTLVEAAPAVELYRNRTMRWFGWLQGTSMGAGLAEAASLYVDCNPVNLPLREPRLAGVGWQTSAESAMFAALGTNEQGKVRFAWVEFNAKGEGSVKTADLSETVMPQFWAVRFHPSEKRFDVVTAHQSSEVLLLVRQSVNLDGTVAPPVKVGMGRWSLAALAMDPLATDRPGVVDALFGPSGEKQTMMLYRCPVDGGPMLLAVTFDLGPQKVGGPAPEQWTLPAAPVPDQVVFYKWGDRLLSRRGSAQSSSVVAERAENASQLKVVVVKNEVWGIWADAMAGLMFRRLR